MTPLISLSINKRIIDLLKEQGITNLFPTQSSAFGTQVLDGGNLVLAVPTSSGKTLVAEICMLKCILDGRGKALYLVPLRSLAREKYLEFKKYETLGITTAMSVGDYDSPGTKLKESDTIILTTERADSLVRHNEEWLQDIGIVVIDEVHLVNDASRGPTLEMVIAKLRQIIPNVQLVALSATISNAEDIAEWLDAELVKSNWRPVKLNEGVFFDGEIRFQDGSTRAVDYRRKKPVTDLVCDILSEDGQVLIFVSSRRSTISAAKRIASSVRPYLSNESLDFLGRLANKIDSGPNTPETSKVLARLMRLGVAFHHAGLSNQERTLIEEAFKRNHLHVITATPTLAAGVNLPARRVIIRDYKRYEPSRGSYPIPVLEYKQMAGRAGRPKYDEYGEALLIARTEREQDYLLDNYTRSETEEITSKLASEVVLRSHLLASIASGVSRSRQDIDELINRTFFTTQFESWEIDHLISDALDFLTDGELIIRKNNDSFEPTRIGKRTSDLYISPSTAISFRDSISPENEISLFGLLHFICRSSDQPTTYVTKSELEEYELIFENNSDELLIDTLDIWDKPREFNSLLGELKTARILLEWISETTEKEITAIFKVGMGDVHRYTRSAEWLLYAASEIAKISGGQKHLPLIHNTRTRMKHGVKSDILELVNLRGIGRVRGRMLYSHGFSSIPILFSSPLEEIARVPSIGTSIAVSIKKQLGVDVSSHGDLSNHDSLDESDITIQMLLEDFEES